MEGILGGSIGVFIGMTVILFGGFAFLTGQAVANSWGGFAKVFGYAVLLAGANRFLLFALYQGELLSVAGFLLALAVLAPIAALGFRLTQVRKMVVQYPWLYARSGLLSWREKSARA